MLPLILSLGSALPATGQIHPFSTFDTVDPDYVMVAAHRCGYISNGAITHPEKSLLVAEDTIDLGVEILEVDVRMTSDGGLVLMHDTSVERTTDGSGTVSSMTLAQVRALHLLGPGGVVTTEIVPTLGELMNLDKVDITNTTLRDNIMAILQATDTVDHAIFKGGATAAQVTAMRAAYPCETIHYMPILSNSNETGMINMLTSHTPPATELIFNSASTTILSATSVATATSTDTHIWINSLWSSLCAGQQDSIALGGDPDGSWGWFIGKGATIIQTDNAPQMIPYLESLGLRGGYAVLGLYPDASTSTTNGALDFGRNTTTSGIGAFDYLDDKAAISDTARSGGTPNIPIDGGIYTIIAEIDFDSPTTGTLRGWIHDGTNGSLDLGTPNVKTTFSSGFSTAPDALFVRLGSGSASSWANLRTVWADDGTGATRTDAFAMLAPGPSYAGWARVNLRPSALLLPEDDADGDSCANLLEYFGGRDPGDPASKPLFQTMGFTGDDLVVHYQRALGRPDVTGTLQWSSDLTSWQSSGDSDGSRTIEVNQTLITSPGANPETIEATLQTTSGLVPDTLFVRLAVQ